MANSDKNLVITPNVGSSSGDPTITFSGADASLGAQSLQARIYPTSNGTLSIEGSAGQLFSITNSLTGTIFSVNDISGLPSIEVFDTGVVRLARYTGRVVIGNITDNGVDTLQFATGGSINLPTINANGSITSTGNLSAVRYTSTVATGTSPLVVSSTTLVTNLNADFVDGVSIGTLSAAGGIVYATSTTAIAGTAAGVAGQAVISGGASAPTFQNVASANGASSIVARDVNGDFTARTITATTFSGSGASLTSLNATNISSGTIDNARTSATSANGASTIVARDVNGDFAGRTVTATTFSGSGASLTSIPNSATTAASANGASTIVARDVNGDFTARTVNATTFSGSGASLTSLNATNISSGTLDNARTSAASANGASTIVARDANGDFAGRTITAVTFSGSGASLTNIPNSATTAASANGASTIVARDVNGDFNARTITATTFSGSHSGSGASLTNIPNSATTAASANGASTIVARDVNGDFTARTITATTFSGSHSGSGASLTSLNATNISSGTIDNARTSAASANGASTIVARDVNGSFTAGTITATTFSGSGASLTTLNASNISSGTVPTARLATGTANSATFLRGDQTWATISSGATLADDTTTNATYYPIWATATSGAPATVYVSSTKLTFNANTGTLSATIFNSLSDESFKDNIQTISNAVDTVKKLNGVEFTWKETGKKSYGVIAQELEKILPDLVDGSDPKTVNYSGIIGFLIEAVKELSDRVESLENRK